VTAEKVISIGVPTELVRGDVFFEQSLQAATVLVAVPIAPLLINFSGRQCGDVSRTVSDLSSGRVRREALGS
jgi:hypothetical protein